MNPGVSQQTAAAQALSESWLAHTGRLTLWNLRLARRRLMSKILAAILLLLFLVVIFFLVIALLTERATTQSYTACPPTPVSTTVTTEPGQPSSQPCTPGATTGQDPQTQAIDQELAQTLTFPNILTTAGGYTTFLGTILLCILAGAVIGNEYSFGTQRLALSRGVSRAQLIAAQVAALALLALIVSGAMLLLGTLFGVTLGPLVGGVIPNISLAGWGQLLLYWLVLALYLLAYMLIALLLGTLGRSTAVGIAGSLGYIIFELIVAPILVALAVGFQGGSVGTTAEVVHHALLGPNLSALINGVTQSPLNLGGSSSSGLGISPIPTAQGLFISLLYCLTLVGLSYWLVLKRDVTH
jgi:ABC-type transport system involved in multi-copper enzyme maturation permease subunit